MKVAIGMPIYGGIPAATAMSVFRTAQYCAANGVILNYINLSGPYVHIARDVIVHEFLKSDYEKLFFIDHDESWEVDDFIRLLALSKLYPVVGSGYRFKQDNPEFMVSWLPGGEATMGDHGLIKVRGMGLGFCIIDRGVLERLATKGKKKRATRSGVEYRSIFRVDDIVLENNLTEEAVWEERGEDIAFFDDVRALGIDVLMDPNCNIGHVGQKEWKGRVIDFLGPLKAA